MLARRRRVVQHDVHPSEPLNGGVEELPDIVFAAHVAGDRDRRSVELARQRRGLRGRIAFSQIGEHQRSAALGERPAIACVRGRRRCP